MFSLTFSLIQRVSKQSWEQFFDTETPEYTTIENEKVQYDSNSEGQIYLSNCVFRDMTLTEAYLIFIQNPDENNLKKTVLIETNQFSNVKTTYSQDNQVNSDGLLHLSICPYVIYRTVATKCSSGATAFAYLRGVYQNPAIIDTTSFVELGTEDSNWGPYIEKGNETIHYFNSSSNIAYRGSAFYFSQNNDHTCNILYSQIENSYCSGSNTEGYCCPIYFGNNGNGKRIFYVDSTNIINCHSAQYTQCFSIRSSVTMNACSFIAGKDQVKLVYFSGTTSLTLNNCYVDPKLSTEGLNTSTFIVENSREEEFTNDIEPMDSDIFVRTPTPLPSPIATETPTPAPSTEPEQETESETVSGSSSSENDNANADAGDPNVEPTSNGGSNSAVIACGVVLGILCIVIAVLAVYLVRIWNGSPDSQSESLDDATQIPPTHTYSPESRAEPTTSNTFFSDNEEI